MTELAKHMTMVPLTADSPDVDRLVSAYRERFGMGPRTLADERAEKWSGVEFEGKVVAVYGERRHGRAVEITDAYHDESIPGTVAFAMVGLGYYNMVQEGAIDELIHTSLFANEKHWKAVMEQTGDSPYALVFVHKRKVA